MPAPDGNGSTNGWGEYKRLVVDTLDRLSDEIKSLREEIVTLKLGYTTISVKMGIIGALSGMVAGAVIGAIVAFLAR